MSTLAVWFLPSGNAYFRLLCLQCVCGAATGAAAAAGSGLTDPESTMFYMSMSTTTGCKRDGRGERLYAKKDSKKHGSLASI